MSDHIAEIAFDARHKLLRAELVCEHWRKAALEWGDVPFPGRLTAHPLCLVLEALTGDTSDPVKLGVMPDSEEGLLLTKLCDLDGPGNAA